MAILQRPYAGQVKNLTPPAAGCGGWFLAVGGVICCCEVWQGWQAVGAVQAGQGWRWCVVIVGGGLLLAWSSGAALAVLILPGAGGGRCDLLRRRCAGVVIVATAATPSACRAADPAGRAGGKMGKRKRPGLTARRALLLWPLVCTGGAIRCAGCVPVQEVGAVPGYSVHFTRGGRAAPDPGATVPAGNVPAWHGLRWRCSIRVNFAVCRRGQILHLTGLRGRCRALT